MSTIKRELGPVGRKGERVPSPVYGSSELDALFSKVSRGRVTRRLEGRAGDYITWKPGREKVSFIAHRLL